MKEAFVHVRTCIVITNPVTANQREAINEVFLVAANQREAINERVLVAANQREAINEVFLVASNQREAINERVLVAANQREAINEVFLVAAVCYDPSAKKYPMPKRGFCIQKSNQSFLLNELLVVADHYGF